VLLLSLQVHLQAINLALVLVDLVLHVGDSLVELSFLALVSQHQRRLLVLSILSSLLNFTLSVVEVLSFLLQLGLEIEDLLVSISLDLVQLLLQAFDILLLFLPFLGEVGSCTLGISESKFKLFVEERLILLELGSLRRQLLTVLVRTVFLLLKSLVGFLLQSGQILLVCLFGVGVLIVEQLTLILECLLKASLGVVKLLFLLLVLLLEEGELALPQCLLLIKSCLGFLEVSLATLELTLELLEACSSIECRLFLVPSEF